eukprot:gnl/Dysnectes_brevis/7984_a13892_217.p1 GENE.gnl/Dysnectes_brevis/7984_a13892_217~~gnl/Dysnectes_brevis/7984_a13892_217.p1  ORF type:complete len:598 (-),score=85.49 gnl/Dysnectes_brevis/7984_a13892_217:30-1823(-)
MTDNVSGTECLDTPQIVFVEPNHTSKKLDIHNHPIPDHKATHKLISSILRYRRPAVAASLLYLFILWLSLALTLTETIDQEIRYAVDRYIPNTWTAVSCIWLTAMATCAVTLVMPDNNSNAPKTSVSEHHLRDSQHSALLHRHSNRLIIAYVLQSIAVVGSIASLVILAVVGEPLNMILFATKAVLWINIMVVAPLTILLIDSRSIAAKASVVLVSLALLCVFTPPGVSIDSDVYFSVRRLTEESRPALVAHAGARAHFPPNSLLAAEGLAARTSPTGGKWSDLMVEVDVMPVNNASASLSVGGAVPVFICHHDPTFQYLTNIADVFPHRVTDAVGTFTLEETSLLEIGGRWSRRDPFGELHSSCVETVDGVDSPYEAYIPTLASFVSLLNDTTSILLDLKQPAYHNDRGVNQRQHQELVISPDQYASIIRDELSRLHLLDSPLRIEFSSQRLDLLTAAHELMPQVPVACPPESTLGLDVDSQYCRHINTPIWSLDDASELITASPASSASLLVWTINSRWLFGLCWRRGVSAVTTDRIGAMWEVVPPLVVGKGCYWALVALWGCGMTVLCVCRHLRVCVGVSQKRRIRRISAPVSP